MTYLLNRLLEVLESYYYLLFWISLKDFIPAKPVITPKIMLIQLIQKFIEFGEKLKKETSDGTANHNPIIKAIIPVNILYFLFSFSSCVSF